MCIVSTHKQRHSHSANGINSWTEAPSPCSVLFCRVLVKCMVWLNSNFSKMQYMTLNPLAGLASYRLCCGSAGVRVAPVHARHSRLPPSLSLAHCCVAEEEDGGESIRPLHLPCPCTPLCVAHPSAVARSLIPSCPTPVSKSVACCPCTDPPSNSAPVLIPLCVVFHHLRICRS